MKILFFARHLMYLRNFDSALRLLASHGHQVHIAAAGREETFGGHEMVDQLCRDNPGITTGPAPARTDDTIIPLGRLAQACSRRMTPRVMVGPPSRARPVKSFRIG